MAHEQSRGRDATHGKILTGAGIAFIVEATLSPFTFDLRPIGWSAFVGSFGMAPSTFWDLPRNILLFLPFGVGLASWFGRHQKATLLFVVLVGALTTASVEALQVFLPGRTANVSDMIGNTLGACAGWVCVQQWPQRLSFSRPSPVHSTIAFAVCLLLTVALVGGLLLGTRPRGWDPGYRMALGNELTADKPWRGTLRDLVILDRSVDDEGAQQLLAGEIRSEWKSAVVATYPLSGATGLQDTTGRLPNLVWQGAGAPDFPTAGVALRNGVWLATETGVGSFGTRINRSRQFTVAFTVGNLAVEQDGPARIITVSADPSRANMTLAQDSTHLVLRWRSPVTRLNGMSPEVEFPGVFDSPKPQRVVVAFDGLKAVVRTSRGFADSVVLGPEVVLSAILRSTNCWSLTPNQFAFWESTVPLYALCCVPLGGLLFGALGLVVGRRNWVAFGLVGVLTPALLLEGLVATSAGGQFHGVRAGVGVACTAIGFIAGAWSQRSRFRECLTS